MSQCGACGCSVRGGARFCGGCGASVATNEGSGRRCSSCDRPARDGAAHCGGCGVLLTAEPVGPGAKARAHVGSLGPILYVVPEGIAASMTGVLAVKASSALEQVQRTLREDAKSRIKAVCLVGSAHELPFVPLEDPCGYDEVLWTDSPYGMHETPTAERRYAGDVLPNVPVSRIPTSDTALIARLRATGADLSHSWQGGVAVSAAVWQEATAASLTAMSADVALQVSPPRQRQEIEASLAAKPGRLLFNVHGTDQDAVWYGEDEGRYPEVLRPSGVGVSRDAIVVSEACYGASLSEGDRGLAHSFLTAGAGCFLGSTIIAWGSARHGPPTLADVLVTHFYQAMDEGLNSADALQRARLIMVEDALNKRGGLSSPLHNTLLSFVIYGAPDASARPRAGGARSGAPRANVLQSVRERLRTRMSPADWQVLSSGRFSFQALSQQFRHGDGVTRRLEELLGTQPAAARLVRYRTSRGELATVMSEVNVTSSVGSITHRAGVEVDADGKILDSFVSR